MSRIELLVVYDIAVTSGADGSKRLRKVAKLLEGTGQRVQESVFEVLVQPSAWIRIESELVSLIDQFDDSIRVYRLPRGTLLNSKVLGKPAEQHFEYSSPWIV